MPVYYENTSVFFSTKFTGSNKYLLFWNFGSGWSIVAFRRKICLGNLKGGGEGKFSGVS